MACSGTIQSSSTGFSRRREEFGRGWRGPETRVDAPCDSVARLVSGETELSQGGEETEGIELYPSVPLRGVSAACVEGSV